jgi:PAS domain S-box-containing protein
VNEAVSQGKLAKPEPLRVLIIEESVADTFSLLRELQRGGFHVDYERAENPGAMQQALDNPAWDLVIANYSLPQFGGLAPLALFQQRKVGIPFIYVSSTPGEDLAVEALKAGASDYLMKSRLERLVPSVRKELQAALEKRICRQTEGTANYLALLVKSCNDAIIGETLDGTIVSWNSGAERLYGYSAVEMVGKSILKLVPPYRPQEITELLERIRLGHHVERYETVRRRKDGTLLDVSLTLSPVRDPNGRIIGASAVAQDITALKRQESVHLGLIQDLTSALARVNHAHLRPSAEDQARGT